MRASLAVLVGFSIACSWYIGSSDAWSGHTVTYKVCGGYWRNECCCDFWGWCLRLCSRWVTNYRREYRCAEGWTHNGNYDCSIPICRPDCDNGGTCQDPNDCACPSTSRGRYSGCNQVTCSYKRPCFPGNCRRNQNCDCDSRFRSNGHSEGCLIFDSPSLKPTITKSTVTLANTRRTDNKTSFYYTLDGTNKNDTDILWSNQKRFNNLKLELDSVFQQPEDFPKRPLYVHETAMGVVDSYAEVNVTKHPKNGGSIRDPGFYKKYQCQGSFTKRNPEENVATCKLIDDQYKTLMEHADWMRITFYTTSGGYQDLINLDNKGQPYDRKYYSGLQDIKQVEIRFDFIAPKHCSQPEALRPCPSAVNSLSIDTDITQDPFRMKWSGWEDDLSGLDNYYVELFKLGDNGKLVDALVELTPLVPLYSVVIPADNVDFPLYRPAEPGMYSVLLTVSDKANNTRIARRLVLYDNKSAITVSNSSSAKLYVSSAEPETGHRWQNMASGSNVTFVVNWTNHFVNKIHTDGKLLQKVAQYPIQFDDIKDDNILSSRKFVDKSLDDEFGKRTVAEIHNSNGIVKFEMKAEHISQKHLINPSNTWETISPIAQTSEINTQLPGGDGVRITIRATDAMGHVASDVTTVRVDSTPPEISNNTEDNKLQLNVVNGTYNFTSRVTFLARDKESGVFKLGYKIILHLHNKDMVVENTTHASIGKETGFDCFTVDGVCYLSQQTIDLDNCLFMVNKDDIEYANATLVVSAYNQAMLIANTSFEVGRVSQLKGLEKYYGPTNIRIEHTTFNGFRVVWDLPEKTSCYGQAQIVIALLKTDPDGQTKIDTFLVPSWKTHYDILGLDSASEYNVTFGIMSKYAQEQDIGVSLVVKTASPKTDNGVQVLVIVVVAMGVLVIVVLIVCVVLVKQGVIHPRERAASIRRTVSNKYRKTFIAAGYQAAAFDSRQSELYIYGGMDLTGPQVWKICRNDVTLETLILSAQFANIYKATLTTGNSSHTVVAKTLKERYSANDELLMKAKISFLGTQVGDHPNVLKFIGAVTDDTTMGPFIIYEYCENGSLKDYLAAQNGHVTVELQENLFRFGLDIARGMEYLAGKGIVHRRLAARNILLTFLNEVKISGFGPQPLEDEKDDDAKKMERIPIKWVAPECMKTTRDATEQSDVWSYAVVMWEIFTLGEIPYANIRSRDLSTKIKHGSRLNKPEYADDTWYGVMKRCWSYEPSKRPSFADIRAELDNLFVAAPDENYYYYTS